MKPILTIASLLCLALAGPACGKKGDDKKQEEPAPAAKQAEPTPAPTPPEPEPEPAAEEPAVPTAEDFEEETEQAIPEDGLEKEVQKLEKEVPEQK